jgi:toxin ParE1/3/4
MANKYTLRYLPAAYDDLIAILDWIAEDSPANAAAFVEAVELRIGKLISHPFLGHIPHDDKLAGARYRVLVLDAYLVFYIIRGRTVEIHRIVHGSRNLDGLIQGASD